MVSPLKLRVASAVGDRLVELVRGIVGPEGLHPVAARPERYGRHVQVRGSALQFMGFDVILARQLLRQLAALRAQLGLRGLTLDEAHSKSSNPAEDIAGSGRAVNSGLTSVNSASTYSTPADPRRARGSMPSRRASATTFST